MKSKLFIVALFALILSSCSSVQKLPVYKQNADKEFSTENYQAAFSTYEKYINGRLKNKLNVEASVYHNMGIACWMLGKNSEAISHFENALDGGNYDALVDYASLLNQTQKYNEELTLWQKYYDEIQDLNVKTVGLERQVLILAGQKKLDEITSLFKEHGEIIPTASTYMAYVLLLEENDQKAKAFEYCNFLLKTNPSHVEALFWKGKYLYHKADDKYKTEMAIYNKNKNHTSYAYLRRELKKLSVDFRNSRDAFNKLHEIDPGDTNYIKYLKNVNLRLDNKIEADKYDKMLK